MEHRDNRKEPLELFKIIKGWTRSVVIEIEKEIGFERDGS